MRVSPLNEGGILRMQARVASLVARENQNLGILKEVLPDLRPSCRVSTLFLLDVEFLFCFMDLRRLAPEETPAVLKNQL